MEGNTMKCSIIPTLAAVAVLGSASAKQEPPPATYVQATIGRAVVQGVLWGDTLTGGVQFQGIPGLVPVGALEGLAVYVTMGKCVEFHLSPPDEIGGGPPVVQTVWVQASGDTWTEAAEGLDDAIDSASPGAGWSGPYTTNGCTPAAALRPWETSPFAGWPVPPEEAGSGSGGTLPATYTGCVVYVAVPPDEIGGGPPMEFGEHAVTGSGDTMLDAIADFVHHAMEGAPPGVQVWARPCGPWAGEDQGPLGAHPSQPYLVN